MGRTKKTVELAFDGETYSIETWVVDSRPDGQKGLPLVHLHGHASEVAEGAELIDALGKRSRRVIAMDLPSCGDATKLFFPMIRWADGPLKGHIRVDSALWFTESFVWALIEQHFSDLGRFVVSGGSLGGNLALRMNGTSATYGGEVAASCAWSAACVWSKSITDPAVSRALEWSKPDWAGEPGCEKGPPKCREEHFWRYFAMQSSQWYGKKFPPGKSWTKERRAKCLVGARAFRERVYCEEYRSADWRIVGEQIDSQASHFAYAPTPTGWQHRYKTYRSPTWLGWGEQDDFDFTEIATNSRKLAKRMKAFGLDVVDKELWTGHSIHNEAPDELATEIDTFLSERGL